MIRKFIKLIALFIMISMLGGCWDYRDINERCISLSIGVDDINKKIEFSGEIAKLSAGQTTQGNKEKAEPKGVYNLLSYGKNFEQARVNYDSINPYPVFLGAARVVVFGENFAKKGIEAYVNRVNKFYDYRKTLLMVVSRERPKELFKISTDKDICVGFLIEDICNSLKVKKMTVYSNVGEILSDIAVKNIGYMLPYIGIEKGSIKYLGLAVMKNSKMIDIIDAKDTDGILYLLGEKAMLTEDIPFSKNTYSIITSVKKKKIKTKYVDEQVVINIDLNLGAQLEYQYSIKPLSDKNINKLEDIISKKVKKDITNIIEKSQKNFECDIFGFAKYFRADNPRIYKKIDWKKEYLNADINVNVKTRIKNLGLMDPNAKKKY